MSTLQDRLEKAMKHGKKTRPGLAAACGVSRAAVSKWFMTRAKNLKMEHLFKVADECNVEARWLATGEGPMERGKKGCEHGDIPIRRIDLIRKYGRLPDEIRFPIRQLIEGVAYFQHERKGSEYTARMQRAQSKYRIHEKEKSE